MDITWLEFIFVQSFIVSTLLERIKKSKKKPKIRYNILILLMAIPVGIVGTLLLFLSENLEFFTVKFFVAIPTMILATWFFAMTGYDKVMQTVTQVQTLKLKQEEKKEEKQQETTEIASKDSPK